MHPGALQIEMSEESDQGKYECVATNRDGTRYSTPANLYVRGKSLNTFFYDDATILMIMCGWDEIYTHVSVDRPILGIYLIY